MKKVIVLQDAIHRAHDEFIMIGAFPKKWRMTNDTWRGIIDMQLAMFPCEDKGNFYMGLPVEIVDNLINGTIELI